MIEPREGASVQRRVSFAISNLAHVPERRPKACCCKCLVSATFTLLLLLMLTPYSRWLQRQILFIEPGWPPVDYGQPGQPYDFGLPPKLSRVFMLHPGLNGTSPHWLEGPPRLGVWLTSPTSECVSSASASVELFVLYAHGTLETRANPLATSKAHTLSGPPFCASVVSFDYRGFGDSSGTPSEGGLVDDALRVWKWIRTRRPAAVGIIYGHSLGTGVAVQLAWRLQQAQQLQPKPQLQGEARASEGGRPAMLEGDPGAAALVLESAFSSIAATAADWMPPWPPRLRAFVDAKTVFRFDSCRYAGDLSAERPYLPGRAPLRVLQLHATADHIVPRELGRALHRAFPAELGAQWVEAPLPATHDTVFLSNDSVRRACSDLWSAVRRDAARALEVGQRAGRTKNATR